MMDWDTYYKRKRLNIAKWFENNNIKSYQDLIEKCDKINVIPPPRQEIDQYFNIPSSSSLNKEEIIEEKVAEAKKRRRKTVNTTTENE